MPSIILILVGILIIAGAAYFLLFMRKGKKGEVAQSSANNDRSMGAMPADESSASGSMKSGDAQSGDETSSEEKQV